jgi:hypothetical protein
LFITAKAPPVTIKKTNKTTTEVFIATSHFPKVVPVIPALDPPVHG